MSSCSQRKGCEDQADLEDYYLPTTPKYKDVEEVQLEQRTEVVLPEYLQFQPAEVVNKRNARQKTRSMKQMPQHQLNLDSSAAQHSLEDDKDADKPNDKNACVPHLQQQHVQEVQFKSEKQKDTIEDNGINQISSPPTCSDQMSEGSIQAIQNEEFRDDNTIKQEESSRREQVTAVSHIEEVPSSKEEQYRPQSTKNSPQSQDQVLENLMNTKSRDPMLQQSISCKNVAIDTAIRSTVHLTDFPRQYDLVQNEIGGIPQLQEGGKTGQNQQKRKEFKADPVVPT